VSSEAVEAVSTWVSRMVPAGKVAGFEPLLHEMITAARGFEGHLGVDVLRPDGGGLYQIIFRYRSRAEQRAWMASEQRRELVARID
jgi:antibiotic biosynthesis monooxygenase (ABM) superfamily enzyme